VNHDFTDARWHKSSRSGNSGGQCVEVAGNLPNIVGIRDSKHRDGPVLAVSPTAWTAFAVAVKSGQYGHA
jgi:hypothetical protein